MVRNTAIVERLSFRDTDHSYHLDGKRLPSVTTILGNLSKVLHFWSVRVGAAALEEYLTAQLVEDGLSDGPVGALTPALINEAAEIVRTEHTKRKQKAATKGSVVHDAIQAFHENYFDAVEPEDPAAAAAWRAFIAWWAECGLTCVSVERKIVGPDQSYAGRLDLLAEDANGGLYVCDAKTSNGIYDTHLVQNAAYAEAIETELGREVVGTKVLWLPEGVDKLVVVERDSEEWRGDFDNVFAPLLTIHPWRNALTKWTKEINAATKETSVA